MSQAVTTPGAMAFFARSMDVDPAQLLPGLRCPVLALFGGGDDSVPVAASVATFATAMPEDARKCIAVFPGADHGLFVDGVIAPGFLPMLTAFLSGAPERVVRPSHRS